MSQENEQSGSLPMYRHIAADIERSIQERKLVGNSKLPSEIELATQYGVSRGTVTKALDMLVQHGVLYRRRPQGTFVASSVTKQVVREAPQAEYADVSRLSGYTPPVVGLIMPYVTSIFLGSIILGISTIMRTASFALSFAYSENDCGLEQYHIEQFLRQGVAGMLIFPGDHSVEERAGQFVSVGELERIETLRMLQRRNVPFVLMDRYVPEVTCDYVVCDDVTAGYAATQHLFSLGHQRIGFVTMDCAMTSGANRYLGYIQSLRENKQPVREHLILQALSQANPLSMPDSDPPSFLAQRDRTLLAAYLRQPERPDAIVAMNDYLALHILQTAESLGIDVPGELALVSCGSGDLGMYLRVPLTSIVQPAGEMGRQSAHILLDRIAQRSSKTRQVVLPVSLVVRKSCGAERSQVRRIIAPADAG